MFLRPGSSHHVQISAAIAVARVHMQQTRDHSSRASRRRYFVFCRIGLAAAASGSTLRLAFLAQDDLVQASSR